MSEESPSQHVIIIGAPRSGTNMLRDLLCTASGIATWPCDEINYIWRHGNVSFPSDAFTEDMARPPVCAYIRKNFAWVSRRYRAHAVVEKTCANSLRVAFVDRVLSQPRFIFVHRNGIDAVASAMRRWAAKLDLAYTLRKASFIPISDLPYHSLKFIGNRLSRIVSPEKRLKTWGPMLPAESGASEAKDLAELCAIQWRTCVDASLDAFEAIPSERVLRISYEELVNSKDMQVMRIARFAGADPAELLICRSFQQIRASSIGKGYSQLPRDVLGRVSELIRPTMARLGY